MDYYKLLGLTRDATQEEIKKAYRKLAREYHPDVCEQPDAEERFKEIATAYEVLSDPGKKQQYDTFGTTGRSAQGFNGMDDAGFGNINDLFDMFFSGGSRTTSRPRKQSRAKHGENITIDLRLDFEEAVLGCKKKLSLKRFVECEDCGSKGTEKGSGFETCYACSGSGQIQNVRQTAFGHFSTVTPCLKCAGTGELLSNPCKKCKGSGRIKSSDEIELRIPAGIDENVTLRVDSKGHAGSNGGPAGDLYVVIHVSEHEYFKRSGNNLATEVFLDFTQLALGTEIEVPTLFGDKKVSIPAGTQTGHTIILEGLGVPYFEGRGKGNQTIKIVGVTPTNLTKEEKTLLKQLAELRGAKTKDKSDGILGRLFSN